MKDHAKLVCAMVEWVEGAAALPENTPTFVQEIPTTTAANDATTSSTPSDNGNDTTASSTSSDSGNGTLYTLLIVVGVVVVLGGGMIAVGVLVLKRPDKKE